MAETFDDIAENFAFLDDWEDRYRYVIELGKAMDELDPALQVPATKVDGCASQVWIAPRIDGTGPDATVHFDGTSDALIVKGLIAVLKSLLSGRPAREILATDVPAEMARLGLDKHLSSQRSNGLRAMIARVRDIAARTSEEART